MRLLLDSHAYLWWLTSDRRLGGRARTALADPETMVFVSAATIWELTIKRALGRLAVQSASLCDEISANGFHELPVSARHAERAGELPKEHDDPFDRMLVAQAQIEDLTCVTKDETFDRYDVATLW